MFNGYLIKATASGTNFDNHWLTLDSYESTPNMREELVAYRDDYTRDLTRVTASGTKSQIKFTTKSNINYNTKVAIQNFFYNNEVDHLQRKIQLTYWNDEENNYKTSYFYRPDITFSIKRIDGNNIFYNALDITLVEY